MKHIVILTGAGVSAESGVPTFRDAGGLWEGHRIEDVATPTAFRRNPELVHRFYNLRRKAMQNCEPNQAHRAIARLQKAWGIVVLLIAVFPANLYLYQHQNIMPASPVIHLLRLPLQGFLFCGRTGTQDRQRETREAETDHPCDSGRLRFANSR